MKRLLTLIAILLFTTTISAQTNPPAESALERFLRYAKIDTQSKEDQDKVLNTDKQLVLANLLSRIG